MKKVLALLICLVLCVMLFSCNGDVDTTTAPEGPDERDILISVLEIYLNSVVEPLLKMFDKLKAPLDLPSVVKKITDEVIKIHKNKNIIPVGKHFPGHGDTSVDSHFEMPFVDLDLKNIEENHLKPFEYAINNGLDVIMASHVYYSCFDENPIPASMSKNILTNL